MKHFIWISAALLFIAAGCKKDAKQSLATLSTVAAASITANGAQSGGDVTNTGGSAVTQRGLCWATHSGPTVADSVSSNGTGTGSFTVSLENLASYTTYYVRAYAINGVGTAYGNEQSFTTSTGAPTLSTVAISNLAPLVAQSGGNIVSDGGSPVTARGVCWATSAHPTVDNFKTSDSVGKGAFISMLSSLGSQTTYYVRAYAVNAYGMAYGNEISFVSSSGDVVTDIDGNGYGYLTIGTQTWMTSNLKVTHYQNGDTITNGFTNSSAFYANWLATPSLTTGAYSFPNGDASTNNKYGKYYDNLTIGDARGVCPAGWHIPSDADWMTLEIYEGMSQDDANAGGDRGTIGSKLLEGGSSGLNLQLCGDLFVDPNPQYNLFNQAGFYWSSTFIQLGSFPYDNGGIYRAFNRSGSPDPIYRDVYAGYGMSVRCVKN